VRERERKEEREFERERSVYKKTLLEILSCDGDQESFQGVWNSETV